MSGYETGLVWGFIVGAPLAGAFFWAGKVLIDERFRKLDQHLAGPVHPDEEPTP